MLFCFLPPFLLRKDLFLLVSLCTEQRESLFEVSHLVMTRTVTELPHREQQDESASMARGGHNRDGPGR